jgi:hypothetical protein
MGSPSIAFIQVELELTPTLIQVLSIKDVANIAAYADDVRAKYPEMVAKYQEFQKRFIDSGYLCGQVCAFMAAGKALPLRGKYFDVEQDIAKVLEYAPQFSEQGLYDLKVDFAGGLQNNGGLAADSMQKK